MHTMPLSAQASDHAAVRMVHNRDEAGLITLDVSCDERKLGSDVNHTGASGGAGWCNRSSDTGRTCTEAVEEGVDARSRGASRGP